MIWLVKEKDGKGKGVADVVGMGTAST
jgi:hypothetical protein